MSTKIFCAYRTKSRKQSENWQLLGDIQATARKNVQDVLAELILDFTKDDKTWEQVKADLRNGESDYDFDKEPTCRIWWMERWICRKYKEQLGDIERDLFDLDVTIGVRQKSGRFYLTCYADMLMRNVLDFLADEPRLEYYGYWDNTDMPDDVSKREWAQRGKVWREFNQNWERQLKLEIFSWDVYTSGGILDVAFHQEVRQKWMEYLDHLGTSGI